MAVDGEKMKVSDIIRKLNKLGGENGIGILDIVENRLIGMKDHGIYETPGGTILYFAHEQLEMLTLDKETLHMKEKLAVDYADLIYNGKWYSPLQEALTAFAKKSNEYCTGTVKHQALQGQHDQRRHHLARTPSTPRTSSPSARAISTRPKPPASSTSGACPPKSRPCGNRESCKQPPEPLPSPMRGRRHGGAVADEVGALASTRRCPPHQSPPATASPHRGSHWGACCRGGSLRALQGSPREGNVRSKISTVPPIDSSILRQPVTNADTPVSRRRKQKLRRVTIESERRLKDQIPA